MLYQTGALTSRPVFKGMIRETNRLLRTAEITYSLSKHLKSPKYFWQTEEVAADPLFDRLLASRYLFICLTIDTL